MWTMLEVASVPFLAAFIHFPTSSASFWYNCQNQFDHKGTQIFSIGSSLHLGTFKNKVWNIFILFYFLILYVCSARVLVTYSLSTHCVTELDTHCCCHSHDLPSPGKRLKESKLGLCAC